MVHSLRLKELFEVPLFNLLKMMPSHGLRCKPIFPSSSSTRLRTTRRNRLQVLGLAYPSRHKTPTATLGAATPCLFLLSASPYGCFSWPVRPHCFSFRN